MRNFVHAGLFVLGLCGICLTTSALAETPREIRFSIISTESSKNLRNVWDPLFADMSRQTGLSVKPFFATDYAGVIQGMRFNKVDIGWFGNQSAIEAVDRAGGEVVAKGVNIDGSEGYWSVLIAHRDSPYNSVEDMLKNAANITFGNGDPNSTSGFLVPGYYVFAKNGVDANKIFKRMLNSNHESNALAVASKQVDIATCNSESMAHLKENFPDKYQALKIIWTSPLIAANPVVWRKNLDAKTKEKLKNFLVNYGKNEKEKKILAGILLSSFGASSNDQLLPVRQLGLFKQRSGLERDETVSAAEKTARLKAIDDELAALDQRMKKISHVSK